MLLTMLGFHAMCISSHPLAVLLHRNMFAVVCSLCARPSLGDVRGVSPLPECDSLSRLNEKGLSAYRDVPKRLSMLAKGGAQRGS